MNFPDTPSKLIRAGFYIGIGLGLAYIAVAATCFAAFALCMGISSLMETASRWFPYPWVGQFFLVFFFIVLILGLIFVVPVLRYEIIKYRNQKR